MQGANIAPNAQKRFAAGEQGGSGERATVHSLAPITIVRDIDLYMVAYLLAPSSWQITLH
jgi:hypothetical protein